MPVMAKHSCYTTNLDSRKALKYALTLVRIGFLLSCSMIHGLWSDDNITQTNQFLH